MPLSLGFELHTSSGLRHRIFCTQSRAFSDLVGSGFLCAFWYIFGLAKPNDFRLLWELSLEVFIGSVCGKLSLEALFGIRCGQLLGGSVGGKLLAFSAEARPVAACFVKQAMRISQQWRC